MQDVEEFRAQVRGWLADNLAGEFAALKGLGGPGREHEAFEERRAWNQRLAAAGLTCLGWPEEHGGRGLSTAHRVAFYEEYARADAPDKVNHFGEELLGPTLIAFERRSSSGASCRASATSPSCGVRDIRSPALAATWPALRPPQNSTATSG